MRHRDDAFDDHRAVVRGGHVIDEKPVDLDVGEWQLAQLHQAGIADPEIVDRKPDTLDPETGQRIHHLDQGLGGALGQFEHQPVGRHLQVTAHPFDEVGKVELIEAERRNVECEAGIDPGGLPRDPLPQRGA